MQFHQYVFAAALWATVSSATGAPDPTDATAAVPGGRYASSFEYYATAREQTPIPWRAANDEMGRVGGHVGHVQPGAAGPSANPSAAPEARPAK
jgi:hypothetical protein